MDVWCGHLVVHDAFEFEFELGDGTPWFQCECELHEADGLSGLCMRFADHQVTVICRACGLRTFLICADGCLATLFKCVASVAGCATCYCSKRAPGHEIVAIMSLTSR